MDSMKTLFNVKQKEHESYKIIQNSLKLQSHIGGPIILTKYVPKMTGYDKNKPDEVAK
jgi:hypothetical protein